MQEEEEKAEQDAEQAPAAYRPASRNSPNGSKCTANALHNALARQ